MLYRSKGEGAVGLRLIPVGDRRPVVTAPVRVAVLDAHSDGALEDNGVLDVEAVEADRAGPIAAARERDPVVRRAVALRRAPGGVDVVLGAGAVQGRRPLVAVDEDHVVALAVPVPFSGAAEVLDVEHAAD